jgi:hypothetical protein
MLQRGFAEPWKPICSAGEAKSKLRDGCSGFGGDRLGPGGQKSGGGGEPAAAKNCLTKELFKAVGLW